jgi:pentatricopeptide repeat protein
MEPKIVSATKLIAMNSCAGRLGDARMLFDAVDRRDLLAWSTMIGAYTIRGMYHEVIALVVPMIREGAIPDRFLITRILQACAYAETSRSG